MNNLNKFLKWIRGRFSYLPLLTPDAAAQRDGESAWLWTAPGGRLDVVRGPEPKSRLAMASLSTKVAEVRCFVTTISYYIYIIYILYSNIVLYIYVYLYIYIFVYLYMYTYIQFHAIAIALHTYMVSQIGRVTDDLFENLAAVLLELSFVLQHILGTLVLFISEPMCDLLNRGFEHIWKL